MHTFTLPSGPEVGIVEMSGVEEHLLTSQRSVEADDTTNQVIAAAIPA